MTILEMGDALRAKKVSSLELTNDTLEENRRRNPRLNAFITVIAEAARARASAMDAELSHGIDRGPMHGIPIAHKDLVYTKGVRTTGGSKIYKDFVPDHDADIAINLDKAGAVLVGKTNLHEFAYGITSTNPHFGAVRNPWDTDRIPGGSSGGSGAAIAAGIVPMATGTDTGGSIRIPASFCGITGLKPTFGLISKRGVMPLGWTMDHMGPMTKTVRDCAVVVSRDGADKPAMSRGRKSIFAACASACRSNYYFDKLDLEVAESVRTAVQTAAALGARIVDIKVPNIDEINVVGARPAAGGGDVRAHGEDLKRRADIGPDVMTLLDQGRLIRGSGLRRRAEAAPDLLPGIFEAVERGRLHLHAHHAHAGPEDRADDDEGRLSRRRCPSGDYAADAGDQCAGHAGAVDSVRVFKIRVADRAADFRALRERRMTLLRIGAAIEDATDVVKRWPA